MPTRRDLLKYFAAGTIITTAAGDGALAKLIEVPKVEILEPKIVQAVDLSKVKTVSINIETLDGSVHSFRGGEFRGGYCPYGSGTIASDETLQFEVSFFQSDYQSPATRTKLGQIFCEVRGEGPLKCRYCGARSTGLRCPSCGAPQ